MQIFWQSGWKIFFILYVFLAKLIFWLVILKRLYRKSIQVPPPPPPTEHKRRPNFLDSNKTAFMKEITKNITKDNKKFQNRYALFHKSFLRHSKSYGTSFQINILFLILRLQSWGLKKYNIGQWTPQLHRFTLGESNLAPLHHNRFFF